MLSDGRLFGRRAGCFTLQWHLTNACDGNCRHCYDRSKTSTLSLEQALAVFDDLLRFCRRRQVQPHVSLSGGNPLLYPHFFALYERIAASDARISILGNPISEPQLEQLVALRRPHSYQVSLEGLEAHNDSIRGAGSFARGMRFLELLAAYDTRAHVMLTLTRANMGEVIPLAALLRGRAHRFLFNRLVQVGAGAQLESPSREEYAAFLKRYIAAAKANPIMGFKDGLFNVARHHLGLPLTGGCTGFGCGAAFSFLALLPNGDAHACRKFPSPVGNVLSGGISGAWGSANAGRYRRGCAACRGCRIRNACGGCLAVAHGRGQDVLEERDPHCFWHERGEVLADL